MPSFSAKELGLTEAYYGLGEWRQEPCGQNLGGRTPELGLLAGSHGSANFVV